LTFGSQRYISPCSVLPMDAVERIYGPMKALGYVRQQFYDASMPEAEFKRVTDSITHSLRTVCDYNRGDAHSTSAQVEVDQFRSEKAARAEGVDRLPRHRQGEPQARQARGRGPGLHRQARARERA
jgi:hypothetical protein